MLCMLCMLCMPRFTIALLALLDRVQVARKFPRKDAPIIVMCGNGKQFSIDVLEVSNATNSRAAGCSENGGSSHDGNSGSSGDPDDGGGSSGGSCRCAAGCHAQKYPNPHRPAAGPAGGSRQPSAYPLPPPIDSCLSCRPSRRRVMSTLWACRAATPTSPAPLTSSSTPGVRPGGCMHSHVCPAQVRLPCHSAAQGGRGTASVCTFDAQLNSQGR